mmetsp:Transcript_31275/g.30808  ORF Transcript_31275/g.30808 Transcript_31275/m.30808 type:complete len:100 (-) Transcript_31275:55-354(-)
MKPVREAAIEALNLIKEIDPSCVSETQVSEPVSKSRPTTSDKPWKKQKKNPEEDHSYPNFHGVQEEEPETKKITAATRKRREAQEAKKKAKPSRKPNLK